MLNYSLDGFTPETKILGSSDDLPADAKQYFSLYNGTPPPLIPNPDDLDTDDFSRFYTFFGTRDLPTPTAVNYMMELSTFLGTKGFIYRYGCNGTDSIGTAVYKNVKKSEVFKPFPAFSSEITKNVVQEESTYNTQAVFCAVYNRFAKELKFKPSSGFKQVEERIMGDKTLSPDEQQMQIAIEKSRLAGKKKESAVFSTVNRGMRGMRALPASQVFGKDEMNVPVKMIIINSATKQKKISDLDMQNKSATNAIVPVAFSDYFDIPIFNIHFVDEREALTEYVNKVTGAKFEPTEI